MQITNAVLADQIKNLSEQLVEIKKSLSEMSEKYECRIRTLEDWKLSFVTKFTVYSAIALVIGSFIAQVAIQVIGNWLSK